MPTAQVVALKYPNGRTHLCEVGLQQELTVGAEFDLYGRRWRVSRMHTPSARERDQRRYAVCIDAASAAGDTER